MAPCAKIQAPPAITHRRAARFISTILLLLSPLGIVLAHSERQVNDKSKEQDSAIDVPQRKISATENRQETEQLRARKPVENLKGWNHLYALLIAEGIDSSIAESLITDSRMPKKTEITFKLKPKESRRLYRKHNTKKARQNAMRFYRKHYRFFREAEHLFGVTQAVILAILQVETKCGQYLGKQRVFYRLSRLSSAASREDLASNFKRIRKRKRRVTLDEVTQRAQWLEQEFLPHVIATIGLAEKMNIHPLDLRGSISGAVGLPQFLPGNVKLFGADGNRDGSIDVFNPADAIYSIARFLSAHGWQRETFLNDPANRKAIWHFNHSDAYVSTVVNMATALLPSIKHAEEEIESSLRELYGGLRSR